MVLLGIWIAKKDVLSHGKSGWCDIVSRFSDGASGSSIQASRPLEHLDYPLRKLDSPLMSVDIHSGFLGIQSGCSDVLLVHLMAICGVCMAN